MKSFLSKLRRKLAGSNDTTVHPDLNPLVDSEFSEVEPLPAVEQAKPNSRATKSVADSEDIIGDGVHPDLYVFGSEVNETDTRDDVHGENPIRMGSPEAEQKTSTTETYIKNDTEDFVSGKAGSDIDPELVSRNRGAPDPNVEIEFDEVDDEFEDLIDEDDEFSEPVGQIWEAESSFVFSDEIEDINADSASFEVGGVRIFPEFSPSDVENETESGHWEDLLDLDLFGEDPDLSVSLDEEDTITDAQRLDDYAARLVSQMRIIELHQRSLLQRRWKAILEEFPFSSSYRALSRLVHAGNSLRELEDACELKCLWREAPWLWSHRKFNKMQRAWETEERSNYRSALTWKLALTLIHRVGRTEAERRIFDDWRSEWLEMQLEHASEGVRIDPRFWSYPAFLNLSDDGVELADTEAWYYEEPIDIKPSSSFRLEDSEGQIWRFEPKDGRCDTGFLSLLPYSKRLAAKQEAEAKEASKDE